MIPIIAIIGKKNVGKSTLFNRITNSKSALVSNTPYLTRDRQYKKIYIQNTNFVIVDTSSIKNTGNELDKKIEKNTILAIKEAHLILFLVDLYDGITQTDHKIKKILKSNKKKILLVANKLDKIKDTKSLFELYSLGFTTIHKISAHNGNGIPSLLEIYIIPWIHKFYLLQKQIVNLTHRNSLKKVITITIIGRPNVGKSTLINHLKNEDRMITHHEPGTTRDSILTLIKYNNKIYKFIDTAGIRKNRKIKTTNKIEKISILKSLKTLNTSDIALLIIDAKEKILTQDVRLCNNIINSICALIIIINKSDLITKKEKKEIIEICNYRFNFIKYIKIQFISALYGQGIEKMFTLIDKTYQISKKKFSTSKLTSIMRSAIKHHHPLILSNKKKIQLKFAHCGNNAPFTVIIHGNLTEHLTQTYKRYLTNYFRKKLKLENTQIKLFFKKNKNPYQKQ